MTIYEKELVRIIENLYGSECPAQITERLINMGVIDFSRCKILCVRSFVDGQVREGIKKNEAMWTAAEKFSCSYEYIRKCVYYYRDINL